MKYFSYLLLTSAALCCSQVKAATYYVDATNGNDTFSGTTASVSATNGPWQSIAKVNTANLLPGDRVLFSCGQTWYETLKPINNGTATANIYFGSSPSQCTNKPKISGFNTIDGYNWQLYQGNIWQTTLFPQNQNLIINTNFPGSVANWGSWPTDASVRFSPICPLTVAGCMRFIAGSTNRTSLTNSNIFPVIGGQKYTVTVAIYVPINTSATLIVRENGNDYASLGLAKNITGNAQWQNVSVEFTATRTISNARLDIVIPKTKQIFMGYANVQKSGVISKPNTILFKGDPVTIAHHPNAGFDITRPESVYLRTTAASPTITDATGKQVSSQIITPDLQLPAGSSVSSGTKLILHHVDWATGAFTVTDVNTNSLSIEPNTLKPLSQAGWGFYFYDELWMLDSPGEWYFDDTSQSLYLWSPTNVNPGNQVSAASLDTAIDLNARSNLTVENLEIDGASTGVNINYSTNITLKQLNIHDIAGRAIDAFNSIRATINANRIAGTGLSAIFFNYSSNNALIENNELSEIGVSINAAGKRISLPQPTEPAISVGITSIIEYNHLSDIGDVGITGQKSNIIASNVIQRSCLSVNDCGAIYLGTSSLSSLVLNNLILDVPGYIDGSPDVYKLNTSGIFLDDGVARITISGNTVKGANYPVKIHNGGKHTISNNIFYGGLNSLIWQQENSMAYGGISGNSITGNQFFSTTQGVAIKSTSNFGAVAKFATYDNNHYSILQSPKIVEESGPGFSNTYKFIDWQMATSNEIARNNDLNSDTPAPITSLAQGLNGLDFMPNGNFSNGRYDWSSWNAISPFSSLSLEGCLPVSVNCIHVIAGASETLINSPKFAITKGKFYRITFDLMSTVDSGFLYPVVRLAGPQDYTSLSKLSLDKVTMSSQWQRHSYIFEANTTAANPNLPNQGARLDITKIPTGIEVWVANIEIAPFDPGVFGLPQSNMLVNTTDFPKMTDCPTQLSNPGMCSNYVTFPEGTVATWPISVPPRSGKIVFTQNLSLVDTDNDGVADSQDNCNYTTPGLEVNTKGCSLTD